jgi:hypothetical protein
MVYFGGYDRGAVYGDNVLETMTTHIFGDGEKLSPST